MLGGLLIEVRLGKLFFSLGWDWRFLRLYSIVWVVLRGCWSSLELFKGFLPASYTRPVWLSLRILLALTRSGLGMWPQPPILTYGLYISDGVNRMGFVLSGMNLGTLIGPFLAGIIYARLGYYAVFAVVLGVIAFDFSLRLLMIEKKTAAKWMLRGEDFYHPSSNENGVVPASTSTATIYSGSGGSSTTRPGSEQIEDQALIPEPPNETSILLPRKVPPPKKKSAWFSRKFPTMALLLSSPRLRAAIYGCFTSATVTASFDAILPMFVKRTFHWNSAGAGLIFLAITVPSLLGTAIGGISDRYGTRRVSLVGFALTAPSLALLGVVRGDMLVNKVLLPVILVSVGKYETIFPSPLLG